MPSKNKQKKNESGLSYRSAPLDLLESGIPSTLDEATRSVEVVAFTENMCRVYDPSRWEVINEILLMRGCRIPKSRQVPLMDSHPWRTENYGTISVIGSYRDMKIDGDRCTGRVFFSTAPEAESPYTKTKEGHITDFSGGYRANDSVWIPDGETGIVEGRSYTGPVRVVTDWTPKELSACPIGADEDAKARSEYNNNQKEVQEMDEKLRKFLEGRGLATSATETEAWAYLEKLDLKRDTPPDSSRQTADSARAAEEARAAGAKEEQERIVEIRAMCGRFECVDLADNLITGSKSIDEARKAVLDHIAARKAEKPEPDYRGTVVFGADERDKFRAAAEDAMILRAGIKIEKPRPGSDELRGYSLVELARMALRRANQNPDGRPLEMVGRALTTSDFPYLLANVANKSLFEGWNTQEETWQLWCGTGSVPDFKTNYSVRASEASDLDEIPSDTEYKYGKRTEAQETYQIATYGKLFAISRQAIINDDLNALSDTPRAHGESAARKVGDVAYAVLTANAAMGDSVALFDNATHANIATSANIAPPGVSTLAAAILAMGIQKDLQGSRRLNIRPEFFIAPRALEGVAEVFFKSEKFSDNATAATDSTFASSRTNPYSGTYFKRIYESRLDDSSAKYWYLAAQKGKTVRVFFLNGIQAPYMETKQGWNVDGVEYKVRIDVGAKAMDWRGLYLNPDT